jgi:hypothetical protein
MAQKGPVGSFTPQTHQNYDRHRFDNYTAWLDREARNKAKAEGKPLGFGFSIPRQPKPPRQERPFWVIENAMASGQLVHRKYDQTETSYQCETMRSDPYHYPNHMEVKDSEHYKDHRRRTQNTDPSRWVVDPKLRDAVPDWMVDQQVKAHRGETRIPVDPNLMAVLFGDDIRPQKETVKQLNCDLSCIDLPEREGGRPHGAFSQASPSTSNPPSANQGDFNWRWCLGGRPTPPDPRGELTDEQSQMLKSQSLPSMLSGKSMLIGAEGAEASPFHGSSTRRFGQGNWDGRMRGGKLARDGWAGSFPEKEARLK